MLPFIPFAWASHFMNEDEKWPHRVTFARECLCYLLGPQTDNTTHTVCFVSIIPLENLFDWGGEQMVLYLGTQLGDLLAITLNKYVPVAHARLQCQSSLS